jgi:transcriptional regulator with XRE-family HTH domain
MRYDVLGLKIKTRRKEMKLTQEDLAEKVGISASFMGHIERGSRVLSVDTLRKLCIVLDLSADALLGLEYDHIMSGMTDEDLEVAQMVLQRTLDIVKSRNHKIT